MNTHVALIVLLAVHVGAATAASTAITPEGRKAIAVDAVAGSDGRLHVIWVEKVSVPKIDESGHAHNSADELHYLMLDPRSGRVSGAQRVNRTSGEVWAFSRAKPVLRRDSQGRLHVLYTANAVDDDGTPSVVARYARSLDDGQTWSSGKTLNRPAGNDLRGVIHGGFAAAHTFGTLITDAEDRVHAYWVDTREMGDDELDGSIYTAVSIDGGETFGQDRALYRNDTCPCCQLTAAQFGSGIALGSRQVFDGNYRDPTIAVVGPEGPSSARTKLGAGRWQLDGCPLKPIALATGDDVIFAAYFTIGEGQPGVYRVSSQDRGARYSEAIPIDAQAEVTDMPAAAMLAGGTIALAWQAKTTDRTEIRLATSNDGGQTFGAPQSLSEGKETPSFPVIVGVGAKPHVFWLAAGRVHHAAGSEDHKVAVR